MWILRFLKSQISKHITSHVRKTVANEVTVSHDSHPDCDCDVELRRAVRSIDKPASYLKRPKVACGQLHVEVHF